MSIKYKEMNSGVMSASDIQAQANKGYNLVSFSCWCCRRGPPKCSYVFAYVGGLGANRAVNHGN